jgi:hypothetical protein
MKHHQFLEFLVDVSLMLRLDEQPMNNFEDSRELCQVWKPSRHRAAIGAFFYTEVELAVATAAECPICPIQAGFWLQIGTSTKRNSADRAGMPLAHEPTRKFGGQLATKLKAACFFPKSF